jgi:hypothetical protein
MLTIPFSSQPPIYGAYLYDAVYQFAIALNKSYALEDNPTGKTITDQLRGIQYDSKYLSQHASIVTAFDFTMVARV